MLGLPGFLEYSKLLKNQRMWAISGMIVSGEASGKDGMPDLAGLTWATQ